MSLLELFVLAVGLSMDAFAVAVCTGLSLPKHGLRQAVTVGLYFGVFQAVMPLLGYLLGSQFAHSIAFIDHWIAFTLLGLIGGQMIFSSFRKEDDENPTAGSLRPRRMLPLALATSIDALVVGLSFAFLQVQILPAVSFIGVITFLLSALGVYLGNLFGCRFRSKAELLGGLLLVLMGTKILLEHLEVL